MKYTQFWLGIALLVWLVFRVLIQPNSAELESKVVFENRLTNLHWSLDSRQLIFQTGNGSLEDDQRNWYSYQVESQVLYTSRTWYLFPSLTWRELDWLKPIGYPYGDLKVFTFRAGDYLVYPQADEDIMSSPLALANLSRQEVAQIPARVLYPTQGTEFFMVYWSADTSAFVVRVQMLYSPITTYCTHYQKHLTQMSCEGVGNPGNAEQVYDLSTTGRYVLGSAYTGYGYPLVVWNMENHANDLIIPTEGNGDVIGATFVFDDESKIWFVDHTGLVQFNLKTGKKLLLDTKINSRWATQAVFSPDGKWLALYRNENESNYALLVVALAE